MRLIILNQFFYPDHSATSQLMTDLAESLVAGGMQVTAVAGRGVYRGGKRLDARGQYRGVRIARAWATSYGKRNSIGRLSDYLSFYLGAALKLFMLPRHDVLMALTTPPMISLLGYVVCRLRRMSLVVLVQDLYPDIGIALGTLTKRSVLTRALDRLNGLVLTKADRVIVLSECMRGIVSAKVSMTVEEHIDVIHNWADGSQITPLSASEPNPFSEAHNLNGYFVVQFSGNFGRVNDFMTPLVAAERLKDREDICFLFIGDGSGASEIEEFVKVHNLTNVRLLPYQERAHLRFSLAAGHAHLVTVRPGLAGLCVPSKTYGILAAGRPILFVGDLNSSIAQLVAANRCGVAVSSGEGERLAEIISSWADQPKLVESMGRCSRQLFEERFDRSRATRSYIESFNKCTGSHKRRVRFSRNLITEEN